MGRLLDENGKPIGIITFSKNYRLGDGHRHNWIAVEWEYQSAGSKKWGESALGFVASRKRMSKLYCPDCKQTQEVQL